ncbi:MAG: carbohydrate ABC transporter permease [Sphaerochaeta sp.]|jgi:raffinose/stachyose/melibiose transport system permease protein|uniref:Carbohydrate ABC transporter permease n=2 Tax=root TaxID=1 RepID=A0ABY4D6D2_9SPIR|nr:MULTISPECIES: carbohydrate ABC transporter permease [Sphaerochaeta]MDT3358323.1 carbohydrate ABC transporter permease [Spirochaetota bacterium]NLA97011.1 carbohydrate ABC transporter permease [Spirochaetales bacterium]MDD2394389.1 carbohydrate ABC transporter permease [Sphaerochaeta sp.]MDD3423626.1 carbohydrate ABC transporter permease [Sphaerochaeta sp.]MDD4036856.1 carbohydrate ABC transporter permease [Sphaerochaeta sp.]
MNDIKDTKSVGAKINMVFTYAVMIFFTVMAIYPLLWLVMNSFKTTTEFQMNKLGFPKDWVLVNYKDAWIRGKFPRLILNSFIYTGITMVATLVFSFMAGFAFAKIPNRATKFLHGSFVIGLLLTLQSIMVPLFLIINWVGLYNTTLGVLIPYIGIAMPMGIYLGTEFIKSIPDALVESARIDGATYLKIFISIIVPMAAPVAVTVAIMTVTGTWNEFMLINILTSSDALKSLPVGVQKFAGALSSDFGKQFAALVIGLVPMLVFYLTFRKEITKGVAAGAVKG